MVLIFSLHCEPDVWTKGSPLLRKHCQKCRFTRCIEAGMKPGWVLSKNERLRRFRRRHSDKDIDNAKGSITGVLDVSAESKSECMGDMTEDTLPRDSEGSEDKLVVRHEPITKTVEQKDESGSSLSKDDDDDDDDDDDIDDDVNEKATADASDTYSVTDVGHLKKKIYGETKDESSGGPKCKRRRNQVAHSSWSLRSSGSPLSPSTGEEEFTDLDVEMVALECDACCGPHTLNLPSCCDAETILARFSDSYNTHYKSVNFGPTLLKEIIMCSLFGVNISPAAAMAAYRLMIERVARVAYGADIFKRLPAPAQSVLLRSNADLMVLLQGALFFHTGTQGLDQASLMALGGKGEGGREAVLETGGGRDDLKESIGQANGSGGVGKAIW